jgi:hypothetical protein
MGVKSMHLLLLSKFGNQDPVLLPLFDKRDTPVYYFVWQLNFGVFYHDFGLAVYFVRDKIRMFL